MTLLEGEYLPSCVCSTSHLPFSTALFDFGTLRFPFAAFFLLSNSTRSPAPLLWQQLFDSTVLLLHIKIHTAIALSVYIYLSMDTPCAFHGTAQETFCVRVPVDVGRIFFSS